MIGILPCFALDKVGNQIHGTGTIQRDDRDNVFEPVRFEAGQEIAHAGTFQLKNPGRFSRGEQREGVWIVERQLVDGQRRLIGASLIDQMSLPAGSS